MALFTIDQLLSVMTVAQTKTTIYATLEAEGVSTTSWHPLSPLRAIVHVVAVLFSTANALWVEAVKGGWNETATQDWLKQLAVQDYGVTPIEATFAQGEITINNAGGGIYAFGPGELVVKNTVTDATYTNIALVNVGALQTGVLATIRATEIGTGSNAAIGQISTLITGALLLTVSNDAAISGEDAETDEELRARNLLSLGALSPNGPSDAYEYIALTPEFNGGANVNRVRVLAPIGDGFVQIRVAGPAGAVSGGDVSLVQAGTDEHATPDGITAIVTTATAVVLTVDITLWIDRSVVDSPQDAPTATDAVKAALIAYVDSLPIGGVDFGLGGKVAWRKLVGVAEAIPGVEQAKLLSEVDVSLTVNQVATLIAGGITVTVNFL